MADMSVEPNANQLQPDRSPRSPLPGELTHTTAPVPTKKTVRQRTSLPVQAYRFTAVTWKMLKIIGRTHQR